MKKILLVFAFLGLGITVNAQEAKQKNVRQELSTEENFKTAVINDIATLDKLVRLEPSLKESLITLQFMRKEAMDQVTTIEDKKAVFHKFGQKLLSGLNDEQRKTLESKDPALFKKLTEYQIEK